ncbi:imidazole glycerol phosphate synthase subunit HisF [Pontibacter sp. BT310]|uniref:Imidazole glycerol phosphate synthase subunit HisF n=1 Tax=Pontibacter populi TaxID=890055 RepID=A0ABS6XC42_9BACT|nr:MULTISPECIES: imidazole glycerol phosphate synthase subunit HisF [Pontibacter]MBJ6117892.1 imidazole glycerol phosphate synthase subunit HisF [Pontibacter sp. BT310]MBR0570319.1 imidazole glycerol phosphate synthase subunit HisF [Microvirga sp. STS03]MBW3364745.1 imidazole glycerol phosphate synthase subunit HisF [Pontibacter populi]
MLTKRIIPCLDIKDGRCVKGVQFENIRDAGDPVELAKWYAQQGADELVFLDITATNEGRKTFAELVRDIARHIDIPFTVGGGIGAVEDVEVLLQNGADKVSINSSAIKNPQLVEELARHFGSQCVTVAIDTKYTDASGWKVYTRAGTIETEHATIDWARKVVDLGAGEILLTSMNNDGTKAGFALDITKAVSEAVSVPVIASGGAGTMQHFADAFQLANADAALAASLFHFRELDIPDLKHFLKTQGVDERI